MNRKFKVGAAVGSGIVARAAEQGGADFLLTINAGRDAQHGHAVHRLHVADPGAAGCHLAFAEQEVLPQASVPVISGFRPGAGRAPSCP